MTRFYMTNPSDDEPRTCALIDRTLEPGDIVEITEAQASTLLGEEPNGFFVGYELPDWDHYHADRAHLLCDLATRFGTDKGPAGHNYTPLYTRHLADLRHRPIDLLEVGVFYGASLEMWEAWFTQATIVGVDIRPAREVNTDRVTTVVADVRDYTPDRTFDVIIDDGSHDPDQITAAATALFPYVRPGGWYIIEDLAVVPTDSSPFQWLRALIDNLATDRGDVLAEVHIYPQIVFLRKR